MKKTKRKAFNFLRSYFDVLNKLQTDEDKLSFLTAIINKQFLNEDPKELDFPVDLAYESQIHAIDSSVKGWLRASKTDLQGNPQDTPSTPSQGETQNTPKEEEEEEKGEVKGKGEGEDELYKSIDTLKDDYLKNDRIIQAVLENKNFPLNSKDEIEQWMNEFVMELKTVDQTAKTKSDFNSHFRNWVNKKKEKSSAKKEKTDKPRSRLEEFKSRM